MAWYLAPALARLRHDINSLWPHRDRSSDGSIGDTAHSARASDHNPDYGAGGIVRAIDVDEDGIPAWAVVQQIIRDPRVAYVIYEGRIWENPAAYPGRGYWRTYSGANAHRHHVHVSVRRGAAWDRDGRSWGLVRTASTGSGTGGGSLPSGDVGSLTPISPTEDDDMPLNDADKTWIRDTIFTITAEVVDKRLRTRTGQQVPADQSGVVVNQQGLEELHRLLASTLDGRLEPVKARLDSIATGNSQEVAQALTASLPGPLASALAPLLSALPDGDIERIRDAAVEALELSKGTISGSSIRFSRVAQG